MKDEPYTTRSNFEQPGRPFDPVAGHFAERHFAERHLGDGHLVERTFCRTDSMTSGLFAEKTFCRNDNLPKIEKF